MNWLFKFMVKTEAIMKINRALPRYMGIFHIHSVVTAGVSKINECNWESCARRRS